MNRTIDTKGATDTAAGHKSFKIQKHLITYEPDQQIGDERFPCLHLCLFFFIPLEKSTQPSLTHKNLKRKNDRLFLLIRTLACYCCPAVIVADELRS